MIEPQNLNIFVTGPFLSGKTTFIQTVAQNFDWITLSIADENHSIALDFGSLKITPTLEVQFYGSPGGYLLYSPPTEIMDNMLGIVVMVDSCRPETFKAAQAITDTIINTSPLPFMVVANRCNDPEAWPIEDLRIALRLPDTTRIVPCIATDPYRAENVLKIFCQDVLKHTDRKHEVTSILKWLDKKRIEITICGPFGSGKSTFIKSVAGLIGNQSSELGLYTELEMVPGIYLRFYELGGARPLEVLSNALKSNIGLIEVVDMCSPTTFKEGHALLDTFLAFRSVPYVIAANRADSAVAENIEQFKFLLAHYTGVQIIPCEASNVESVKNVLRVFCLQVLKYQSGEGGH